MVRALELIPVSSLCLVVDYRPLILIASSMLVCALCFLVVSCLISIGFRLASMCILTLALWAKVLSTGCRKGLPRVEQMISGLVVVVFVMV